MSIESDTRDRVIRMEAYIEALQQDNLEMKSKINEMHEIFTQAKGARAILVVLASLSGFIAAWIPTIFGWFTK